MIVGLISLALLSACAPISENPTAIPTETPVAGPDFTSDVQTALSSELKIDAQDIHLLSAEKVQWRDSCLGVERKGLRCLDVITPGYLLVFETSQGNYEAHTNDDGTSYIFVQQDANATEAP